MPPAARTKKKTRPWILLGAAYYLLGMLLFAWATWRDHGRTLQQGQDRVETLAVALAASAEARLSSGLELLRSVELVIRDAGGFNRIEPQRLRELLRRHVSRVPASQGAPFYALWAVDAQGRILASSLDEQASGVGVAERDYFRLHRDEASDRALLSPLLISKLSGQPVIVQTVRLEDAAGRFVGTLGAALRVHYFDQLYTKLRLPQGSTIVLLREDGRLIYRFPYEPAHASVRVAQMPEFPTLAAQPQGSFVTDASPFDQRPRVIGFKKGDQFPLFAVVSETREQAMAQWRRNTLVYAAIALGALLVAALLLRIAVRQTLRLGAALESSLHDALTGLPNRRALDRQLGIEWKRLGRTQRPLALLFIDVDHFKSFNDHYGHALGDLCLRELARSMAAELRRPGDLLARYGGEEFVGLLPDTDLAGAQRMAQDLIAAVARLAMPHAASPTGSHVTVSIGIASTWPQRGEPVATLLERANAALYRAKAAGRNRMAWADEPPAAPLS